MQLLVLSGVHFLVDMFGNMLPAILPAIRAEFGLSLLLGGLVLVVLSFAANGVQMLTGHTRAEKNTPLLLHIGLVLGATICAIGILPRSTGGFWAIASLAVVSGCGIAIMHPEALRAVHVLDRIPPAISTAVFMTGGFIGYACGGAISTILVSKFGLSGLYPLLLCPAVGILMVVLLKVRLAIEPKESNANQTDVTSSCPPFWLIMAMALPAAVSTTIVATLLPTRLNELGFGLTFGGFAITIYGIGGALGAFVWGPVAHKKGELRCSVLTVFLVVPFLVAYLLLIDHRSALWLLSGAGFCSFAAYILTIALARSAAGPNLGQRMGFIVGGTWALANVVFLALVPVAEHFGTRIVLGLTPFGYLFSGVLGLLIILKVRKQPLHN
jgi:FSR family fosmidomycin resistance protein-like MFS transporter